MRRLKVALISRWYWEENRRHAMADGGATRQLAEAVAALGHEVVVLSQSPEVRTLEKSQIGPLEVWLSPRDKKRDFFTGLRDKWAKQIYRHRKVYSDALALGDFLGRRGPFDVLWAQTEEPDGLVAAMAARLGLPLPPTLIQIQALRYHFVDGEPVFNEKPALSLAFRYATRIVANSDLVARHLSHYADTSTTAVQLQAKACVVHPNLQRAFLRTAMEISAAPEPMPDRVLFFGALNEKKGALVFLEAVGMTDAAKRGATFAVIGDFTEKNPDFVRRWNESLEKVRGQLGLAKLELLGKISPFEVMRQIKLARIVVLPSLFDEFSRALVETLILGRAVITTDRVGTSPLVQTHECGLVVSPHDPEALARAIDVGVSPIAPYTANAEQLAHRLLHEFSPEASALQIAHQLSEIAKTSSNL